MIAEHSTRQAVEHDLEVEVVRFVLEQLRETGERHTSSVLRDAVHHVRSRFPGSPPPGPSRRGRTVRAIRDAVAAGLLVERVRWTCDGRRPTSGYAPFLAVAEAAT